MSPIDGFDVFDINEIAILDVDGSRVTLSVQTIAINFGCGKSNISVAHDNGHY